MLMLFLDLVTVAPEVALGWLYNEKCDVFSFGILMWQIMGVQTKPYSTRTHKNTIQFFKQSVWQGATVRPSMHFKNRVVQENFSPSLQALVESCWSHRWRDRPAMSEVEATLCEILDSGSSKRSEMTTPTVEESFRYNAPFETTGSEPSRGLSSSSSFLDLIRWQHRPKKR
jgi:hypothetical protein